MQNLGQWHNNRAQPDMCNISATQHTFFVLLFINATTKFQLCPRQCVQSTGTYHGNNGNQNAEIASTAGRLQTSHPHTVEDLTTTQ